MWKTAIGHCVYRSAHGVHVHQNYFYRWLTFNSDALQTVINRSNPQKPVLNYVAPLCILAKHNPGNTCMLGLGGGGVAHYLYPFIKKYNLIAVEKSKEVFSVARHYFMINQINNLKVILEDASIFVKKNKRLFKHLIVDLYNEHFFPPECNTEQFFEQCKQNLEKDGYIAINLANPKESIQILNKIRNQFKQSTVILPVKGSANMVVFASNSDNSHAFISRLLKYKQIQRIEWDIRWGYVAKL